MVFISKEKLQTLLAENYQNLKMAAIGRNM